MRPRVGLRDGIMARVRVRVRVWTRGEGDEIGGEHEDNGVNLTGAFRRQLLQWVVWFF